MNDTGIFLLLADSVLIIHFLLVLFVVLGLLAILAGRLIGWTWIYGRGFRVAHLVVIGIVVAQAWLGRLCPLTILESYLRVKAGQAGYSDSFVTYWIHQGLFYEAPPWVFTLIYTVFGGLVFLFWFIDRGRILDE